MGRLQTLKKQEFIEKMQGIGQVQGRVWTKTKEESFYIPTDQLFGLLTRLSKIVGISLDWDQIHRIVNDSQNNCTRSIYYTLHAKDPRCLIMLESFLMVSYVVVRCQESMLSEVVQVLEEAKTDYMTDCLIKRSYVNRIASYYQLPIPYVDEIQLDRVFQTRDFWMDYLYGDKRKNETYPEFIGPIIFRIHPELDFILHMEDDLCPGILLTDVSKLQSYGICFDDGYCTMNLFRWSELEVLCRHFAPYFPKNPAIPLLLLYRFCLFVETDPMEEIQEKLTSAWRSLGLFSECEIEFFVKLHGIVCESTRWTYDPEKDWYHVTLKDESYGYGSYRNIECDWFPFEIYHQCFSFIEANQSNDVENETEFDHFLLQWSDQVSNIESSEFSWEDWSTRMMDQPF